MNARRAGRLLSRVLAAAAETNSTRAATQLAHQSRSLASCSSTSSLWQRALGPWQQWRHVQAQQGTRGRVRTATTTTQPPEHEFGEPDEQNIGQAIIKLEAEALELASEGEPERYVHFFFMKLQTLFVHLFFANV